MLLGAVLAGGRSRRFGSDKAMARLGKAPLIDHVIAALRPQTASIVVCGRDVPGRTSLADRPRAGLGPLGGLAAALDYARRNGFAVVLSAPCDTPGLPTDLASTLLRHGQPTYIASTPVVGVWPSTLADLIDQHLSVSTDLSMRGWARLVGACRVDIGELANINTVDDLARLDDA